MGTREIGFIGAGNMGKALVKGLINSGLYQPGQIMAADKDQDQLKEISEQFGIDVLTSNRDVVRESQVLVLAVKPQIIKEVLEEIKGELRDDHLMISIAAGIPLKLIQSVIRLDMPLIRVMPNTPALIQKGMSALAPGKLANPGHMDIARGIFNAVGETVIVEEEMMDAVTAISGSGPGYAFKIMESMVHAGMGLGFDEETAIKLVVSTFLGASHLASQSDKTLAQLREMVTSPGGTTAAALAVFDEKGLESVIREAVEAAWKRGVELGKSD